MKIGVKAIHTPLCHLCKLPAESGFTAAAEVFSICFRCSESVGSFQPGYAHPSVLHGLNSFVPSGNWRPLCARPPGILLEAHTPTPKREGGQWIISCHHHISPKAYLGVCLSASYPYLYRTRNMLPRLLREHQCHRVRQNRNEIHHLVYPSQAQPCTFEYLPSPPVQNYPELHPTLEF